MFKIKRRVGMVVVITLSMTMLAIGTIVVHATASVDEQSSVVKEDCSKTELKGASVPIGLGEDEVGDISASEMIKIDNISEEMIEDLSTNVRTHPRTGETLSQEDVSGDVDVLD